MASESDRRYTDQEVALVLRRAAEIEEQHQRSDSGRGLTEDELVGIAREVGFSPEVLQEALTELKARGRLRRSSFLGPPLATKRVHAVPGKVDRDELPHLIQIIEDQMAAAGTVSEALGVVRWTSIPTGRQLAPVTQVAVTAAEDETHIQVTQRYPPRARMVFHALPGLWGAMLGVLVAVSAGSGGLASAAIMAGSAVLGAGIGRKVWQWLAGRSGHRVESLTADLVDRAKQLVAARSDTAST